MAWHVCINILPPWAGVVNMREPNIYFLTQSGDSFNPFPPLSPVMHWLNAPAVSLSLSITLLLLILAIALQLPTQLHWFLMWVQPTLACYLTLGCLIKWIGLICQNKLWRLHSLCLPQNMKYSRCFHPTLYFYFYFFKIQEPLSRGGSPQLIHPSIHPFEHGLSCI